MKITIQELSKAFGGRDILSNFSLEVDSGVRLCVCGPNGTGKSTLLRLLAGVESADGGRVILPKGCRLGYVGDVECRLPDGQLTALIIPGPYRFFGLFGRGEEYCIPWECIKQIGDDIILIDKPFPRQEIPRREHRTRRRRY